MATSLAYMFAQRLPKGSVTCIEHPGQYPHMWDTFACDEHVRHTQYQHWLQDGIGQTVDIKDVSLVPLPPDYTDRGEGVDDERVVQYVYRSLKRTITIMDCGTNIYDSLLLSLADQIICVLDCDPSYWVNNEISRPYQQLIEAYGDKVITVLNKWTRYALVKDPADGSSYFPGAVKVPYLVPDITQKALWEAKFLPQFDEVSEDMLALYQKVVKPYVPVAPKPEKSERKLSFLNRKRGKT
ncbi:hypothetical protein GCM10025859_65220 [Alicyclobacillus fastidiosus]|nr:hypothetical protein GCM10025859_65220 [Alicyclobacillus fastidiosus]